MKTYRYNELGDELPDGTITNKVIDITEEEIINQYFPFWSHQMRLRGKYSQINKQTCIDDFVVCNWAWEINDNAP